MASKTEKLTYKVNKRAIDSNGKVAKGSKGYTTLARLTDATLVLLAAVFGATPASTYAISAKVLKAAHTLPVTSAEATDVAKRMVAALGHNVDTNYRKSSLWHSHYTTGRVNPSTADAYNPRKRVTAKVKGVEYAFACVEHGDKKRATTCDNECAQGCATTKVNGRSKPCSAKHCQQA